MNFTNWMRAQKPPPEIVLGIEEGAVCNRNGCAGKMHYGKVRNCSCFISPPCSACADNPLVCDDCGADPQEDAP